MVDKWQTNAMTNLAIACIVVPDFPLRIESVRHPELDGLPLALTDATAQRRLIVECLPEATAEGIRLGMTVRDAINACPRAVILSADPVYYASVFAEILDALLDVSPGIEQGEPGLAWIDLRGLERLYGGLEGVVERLLGAAPPALRPRLGLGANKFVAAVAARRARPGGYRLVPEVYSRAFLARNPVDVLPVSLEMIRRLERFGLYTLRDIARLPAGKLQAQFGPDGYRAWELANGIDSAPFRPLEPVEQVVERLALPAPTVQIDALLLGVRQLARRICARHAMRSRGARQARIQLLIEGQRSWERVVVFKGAIGDAERLAGLLAGRLAGLTVEGPVEEVALELSGLTTIYARQRQLFESDLRRRRQQDIDEVVDELKQRYSLSPLFSLTPVEPWSRIPERRWGLLARE